MKYIQITEENLEKEHICCAIGNPKDPQVISKKKWMKERLAEGLVFLKGDIRGKCFIEYIPAEYAWLPLDAEGYMVIDCFWVSGSCKGHGYADDLLEHCIADAKNKEKKGLAVVSSAKKKPFLSDPQYLRYKGFQTADTAEPYFQLLYLPFSDNAPVPKFKDGAKNPKIDTKGFVFYYSNGCPFTEKYISILERCAGEHHIPFTAIPLEEREAAQNAPVPWTNFAVFYDGQYMTHEILSEKKFLELGKSRMGQEE